MAGEFMQLLASLERRQQMESNADAKIVSSLINAKNEQEARAHQSELNRQHQGNMKMMEFGLNDQKSLNKEIESNETLLEGLGVVIQEHRDLKDDDKTEAGNNLLKLSYDNQAIAVQGLKEKGNDIESRLTQIDSENQTLENRLSTLKTRVKEFSNVNKALTNFSSKLYDQESGQPLGDWEIDSVEMAKFIGMNQTDFDAEVDKFGGGEEGKAEVEMRLRRRFSSYTKDKMEVLNKVYTVQNQKVNNIKIQQDIGLLPAASQKTFGVMEKAWNDNVGELNSTITQLGQHLRYTDEQMDDDPILRYFQGSTVQAGSGISGLDAHVSGLRTRMAGTITEFNNNEVQIPSQFQNDPMAMAKWYSGQIALFDKDWKKDNPDYAGTFDFKDSQGTEYVNVLDEQNKIELAGKRIGELDLRAWHPKQPDAVLFGAIDFFTEYTTVMDSYSSIQDQQKLLEQSFPVTMNINSRGANSTTIRPDISGQPLANSKEAQDRIDNIADIDEFSRDNNLDPATISKMAKDSNVTVADFMKNYGKKADLSSISVADAKRMYYGGDDYIKSGSSKSSERAVEIIERLKSIEDGKEEAFSRYMSQHGDEQRQNIAKDRWFNKSFMGGPWETLHEEGADLVDELSIIKNLAIRAGVTLDVDLYNHYLEGIGVSYVHRQHMVNPDWDYIDNVLTAPVR